ncbi:MAG: MarR family winged helix-turn-helix transcriptional regulator [Solirubrobacteraceae bacterium]|nr:MarR family winged helix-turn-helix transcriptional regulator [Solirubrobacteraceae bacterium]
MCACHQLRRATRGMTEIYETGMAPSDIKATQLPILVALGSGGDLPVTTLAGMLALDRTTLTRNLKVLEDRRLVRTAEYEDDARVRMVSLTLEGSTVLTGALAQWREVQQVVEAQFGRDRLRALHGELAALAQAVGG